MLSDIKTQELARKVRIHAVKMVNKGGSSHIGSVLSIVDILAVLYGRVMQYRSNEPKWVNRDRFILSKGHAGAGVYAVLAECGFFNIAELDKHYQDGSIFSGHVSHKGVPGVELSTGSLGHGLPVASGMALAAKIDKKSHKIFVVMSDGELDEGSNWEAFMFASHHELNNLTAVIDRNKLQSMKTTEETLSLEPLRDKLIAFGWNVIEVDGHNHDELFSAIDSDTKKPKVIIANTIKGKGVSFMENEIAWHYRTPSGELFDQAMKELGEKT
jgi:transketolase